MNDRDFKRNGSGYYDPTAYNAIKNIEAERFHTLLSEIRELCEVSGFTIVGRIVLKDEQTGRVWR